MILIYIKDPNLKFSIKHLLSDFFFGSGTLSEFIGKFLMAIISKIVLCRMKTISANIKSEFFFLLPATGADIFM